MLQLAVVLVAFASAQDLSQATGPRQIGATLASCTLEKSCFRRHVPARRLVIYIC